MLILNLGTILSQYITILHYVYWTMRKNSNSYFLTSYSHNLRIWGVTSDWNFTRTKITSLFQIQQYKIYKNDSFYNFLIVSFQPAHSLWSKCVFHVFHMLMRRNDTNWFCSVTEFSSIFLLYNKFMPIDCHGLCNSAVNSLD